MGAQAIRKSDYGAEEAWASEQPAADDADDHALEQFAADELSHALSHEWFELESLAPFADVLESEPDDGRPFPVVRSYHWADHEGGDMVCEVTVYAAPDRKGHFVRRRCVIRKS